MDISDEFVLHIKSVWKELSISSTGHYLHRSQNALKRSILFLTTASLATNPRLIKSYLFWARKGHNCKIMAFRMNNWSDPLDDLLIEEHHIDVSLIAAGKEDFVFWLKASLLNRFLSYLPNSFLSKSLLAYSSTKRSWQLERKLEEEGEIYDHIEAHNLGALYPAYQWSAKTNASFSFDVEDFHPEEVIGFQPKKEKARRYRLMKELLPYCRTITAASPLIAKETEALLGNRLVQTINNSFFEMEFVEPEDIAEEVPMKLVWFSQKISGGRGLDLILNIYQNLGEEVSLTLIGNLDQDFYYKHLQGRRIEVLEPLPQGELHKLLSGFDVGLLLERNDVDYNRNICLTNKQFAYIQSGLYILATNTRAHKSFFNDYPNLASIIEQTSESLEIELRKLIRQKQTLRNEKRARFEYGKQFSFQREMKKLEETQS